MKKIAILVLILTLIISCKKEVPIKVNPKLINVDIQITPNQWILTPAKFLIDSAYRKGFDNSIFVFYPRKAVIQKKDIIKVIEITDTVEVPSFLCIPLPFKEKVKKGDIVLTWWQKGTGMQRAKIIGFSKDSLPIAFYLDTYTGLVEKMPNLFIDTLKPSTYLLIRDTIMPGRSFLVKETFLENFYIVVNSNKDSILGLSWSGILKVFPKDTCIFTQFNPNLQIGEKIKANYLGSYYEGKVRKIWDDIGKVEVIIDFLGDSLIIKTNICDILKL